MKFKTEYRFEVEVQDVYDSEEILDCSILCTLDVYYDRGDYYQPSELDISINKIEDIVMIDSWGSHFKVSYDDCMKNYKFYLSEPFTSKYKLVNLEEYLDVALHDICLSDLEIDDGGYYD